MSGDGPSRPNPLRIPARILIAGTDLLAGALANALAAYGFVARNVRPRQSEILRSIQWRPDLVLVEVRSLDLASGLELVGELRRFGLMVCVIDASEDDDRLTLWKGAGVSALIDRREPFDQLFKTVNRLLRIDVASPASRSSSTSLKWTPASRYQPEPAMERFAGLTDREQVVLAELMEGHCAEEIANGAFVSISTVRSQIKAILQKLGVNSQLAAVALARRAEWTLESTSRVPPRTAGNRRARVS